MKHFILLLLLSFSVSCHSEATNICNNNAIDVSVADLSFCISSEKLKRIHVLSGSDTSSIVTLKKGEFLLAKVDPEKALNGLPKKLGLSNKEFLNALFVSSKDPFPEIRSAFFIADSTELNISELSRVYSVFTISNSEQEKSKAYIASEADGLYLMQVTEGTLKINEVLSMSPK